MDVHFRLSRLFSRLSCFYNSISSHAIGTLLEACCQARSSGVVRPPIGRACFAPRPSFRRISSLSLCNLRADTCSLPLDAAYYYPRSYSQHPTSPDLRHCDHRRRASRPRPRDRHGYVFPASASMTLADPSLPPFAAGHPYPPARGRQPLPRPQLGRRRAMVQPRLLAHGREHRVARGHRCVVAHRDPPLARGRRHHRVRQP